MNRGSRFHPALKSTSLSVHLCAILTCGNPSWPDVLLRALHPVDGSYRHFSSNVVKPNIHCTWILSTKEIFLDFIALDVFLWILPGTFGFDPFFCFAFFAFQQLAILCIFLIERHFGCLVPTVFGEMTFLVSDVANLFSHRILLLWILL